jgi:hypothetical protein
MDITLSDFMMFTPAQVRDFAMERAGLDEEDADLLVQHKVNGSRLLGSTVGDAKALYDLPGGSAKALFNMLAATFPGEKSI